MKKKHQYLYVELIDDSPVEDSHSFELGDFDDGDTVAVYRVVRIATVNRTTDLQDVKRKRK